jgi:hypothetical protein
MTGWPTTKNKINTSHKNRLGALTTSLKCLQINLQHSRLATDNLLKIMEEEDADIACIQEPYILGNKIRGMPHSLTVLTTGEKKNAQPSSLITRNIDALMITQLSDEDVTVAEIRAGSATFLVASMYFDIQRPIEVDLNKMQAIITYAKEMGIIFPIDSNARSTTWHDKLTNKRGKLMEEFIISRHLYIANEESRNTTFQTCRGASNIDLTVINNAALKVIQDWNIYDQESCSDHNIIQFEIGKEEIQVDKNKNTGKKYIVTKTNMAMFKERLIQALEQVVRETRKTDDMTNPLAKNSQHRVATNIEPREKGKTADEVDMLDEILRNRVTTMTNIEAAVDELHENMDHACRSSFRQPGRKEKGSKHKSNPWWTPQLTTQRKEVNAKRRRYQRTKETVS